MASIKKGDTLNKFVVWMNTPPKERIPSTQKQFSALNDVTQVTLSKWRRAYERETGIIEGTQSQESRIKAFIDKVYTDAMKPSATGKDKELNAKIMGLLIEKKEVKVGRLEDDEYYAIRNKAIAEIEQLRPWENGGDREMRNKPALLLEEPSEDTREGIVADSKVGALELPASNDVGISNSS